MALSVCLQKNNLLFVFYCLYDPQYWVIKIFRGVERSLSIRPEAGGCGSPSHGTDHHVNSPWVALQPLPIDRCIILILEPYMCNGTPVWFVSRMAKVYWCCCQKTQKMPWCTSQMQRYVQLVTSNPRTNTCSPIPVRLWLGGCRGYSREPWLTLFISRETWSMFLISRESWLDC